MERILPRTGSTHATSADSDCTTALTGSENNNLQANPSKDSQTALRYNSPMQKSRPAVPCLEGHLSKAHRDAGRQKEAPLILIADDDDMLRLLMCESMQNAGFRVTDAADGYEVLADYQQLQPDIVLMDVMMPQMDGIAACQAIRNLPAGERTPILMVTGVDDSQAIRRAYEVGATDFITKPINWMILEHRVRYMLRANRTYEALCQSKIRLTEAQRIARMGHWEWNAGINEFICSEELRRIYGLRASPAPMTAEAFLSAAHPDDFSLLEKAFERILNHGVPLNLDHRILGSDDTIRFIHLQAEAIRSKDGRVIGISGTAQDITERKQAEEQITYLAYHDTLTGLPNRRFFKGSLEKELARAVRHDRLVALLFIDLDRFKSVNDTLGHNAGDQLLIKVAQRIVGCIRKSDSLGRVEEAQNRSKVTRIGGDEFAVLLTDIHHAEDAAKVAQRLLDELAQPFDIGSEEVSIGASIGIAWHPQAGRNADTLLRNADMAMYNAKKNGRNCYQIHANTEAADGF